jgi:hypothetical protein
VMLEEIRMTDLDQRHRLVTAVEYDWTGST